ncbi:MAG: type II secretion system minor pseudopilin GspI [Rhizobacter sp.]
MRSPGKPSLSARRRSAHTGHGFTLIEVLVALVIVAITLSAGIKAAGALLGNAQRLTEVSEAQWCADNELTGLRLAKAYPSIGESTFNCQQLGRSYVGTLQVSETPNPNFRRVETRVVNEAGEPMLTLSTILPRY